MLTINVYEASPPEITIVHQTPHFWRLAIVSPGARPDTVDVFYESGCGDESWGSTTYEDRPVEWFNPFMGILFPGLPRYA